MPRKRKDPKDIPLAQPDRSGPTDKTLFQWAEERELFAQAEQQQRAKGAPEAGKPTKKKAGSNGGKTKEEDEDDEPVFTPGQERVLEALLWAATLSTVHFMLDVLVQNQYAMEIRFDRVILRTAQAFLGIPPPPSPFSQTQQQNPAD